MFSNVSKTQLASGLLVSGLAIAGAIGVAALPSASLAQTMPGLTIFGGVDPEYRLAYSIDYNTPRNTRARYYLRVPESKLERAVNEIEIDYPLAFTDDAGGFDPANIELREGGGRGGDAIPVSEVNWNPESGTIEIYPLEPISADTSFVIVMNKVRNPNNFGIHYFNLKAMYQGDILRRYLGTWPLEVSAE